MHDEKKHLTVIMPALNEAPHISQAINSSLKAFDAYGINGEIVVINDGSKDETAQIVNSEIAAHPDKIKLISHSAPMGIGASFWDGVDNARADIVVMLPGDNENDPPEILRYYKLLEHVDIVIPFLFNRESRPLFRNVLSFIYSLTINITFLVNFNYTNGTILYRKSILRDLPYRSRNFFFQTDILIRSVKKGYLFAEVPYKLGSRKCGASKAVNFPSFLKVVTGYVRLVRDHYFTKDSKNEKLFSQDSMTSSRRSNRR